MGIIIITYYKGQTDTSRRFVHAVVHDARLQVYTANFTSTGIGARATRFT